MKEKKNKTGMIKRYNKAQVVERDKSGKRKKTNVGVLAMKTGVDLTGAAVVAPVIGASLGLLSPIAGILLLGLGHFLGDKSGLLRLTGAATLGYAVAKGIENRNAPKQTMIEGTKSRLVDLKENWLNTFYLDKIFKGESDAVDPVEPENTIEGFGAIDVSRLDVFDQLNKESAVNFETEQAMNETSEPSQITFDTSSELQAEEVEDIEHALIEEVDFSTF